MGTLKLVVNNTVTNEAEIAGEFVKDNAPALAEDVFLFILGRISYDALKTACQTQLANWWELGISGGTPDNQYESIYWYLLFLVESRREDELLGNRYINQRVKECACYLINKGKLPRFARGIRP